MFICTLWNENADSEVRTAVWVVAANVCILLHVTSWHKRTWYLTHVTSLLVLAFLCWFIRIYNYSNRRFMLEYTQSHLLKWQPFIRHTSSITSDVLCTNSSLITTTLYSTFITIIQSLSWRYNRVRRYCNNYKVRNSNFIKIWQEQRHFTWRQIYTFYNISLISS